MKRIVLFFSLLSSGCYWSVSNPERAGSSTHYQVRGEHFEVLGTVSDEGKINGILSLLLWEEQEFGYTKLVQKARSRMSADTVIDVAVDRHYTNMFGIFWQADWKASGIAIRYKSRKTQAAPAEGAPMSGDMLYYPAEGDSVTLVVNSWGEPHEVVRSGFTTEYFYKLGRKRVRVKLVNDSVVSVENVE